jgi:hypothetical protein
MGLTNVSPAIAKNIRDIVILLYRLDVYDYTVSLTAQIKLYHIGRWTE